VANLGDCEGGGHLGCAQGGKATIGLVVVRGGTSEYSEIAGFRAANEFKNAHEHQN